MNTYSTSTTSATIDNEDYLNLTLTVCAHDIARTAAKGFDVVAVRFVSDRGATFSGCTREDLLELFESQEPVREWLDAKYEGRIKVFFISADHTPLAFADVDIARRLVSVISLRDGVGLVS